MEIDLSPGWLSFPGSTLSTSLLSSSSTSPLVSLRPLSSGSESSFIRLVIPSIFTLAWMTPHGGRATSRDWRHRRGSVGRQLPPRPPRGVPALSIEKAAHLVPPYHTDQLAG